MRRRAIAMMICCLALAACGQENASSADGKHGPPPPVPYTASPLETYGYSADRRATGVELGRQVYTQWCAICHEGGPGMAGTESLQRKYKGEMPALLRERTDLSPELIATFVRTGVKSMPHFRKTEISDTELEALSLYLTSKGQPKPGGKVVK